MYVIIFLFTGFKNVNGWFDNSMVDWYLNPWTLCTFLFQPTVKIFNYLNGLLLKFAENMIVLNLFVLLGDDSDAFADDEAPSSDGYEEHIYFL